MDQDFVSQQEEELESSEPDQAQDEDVEEELSFDGHRWAEGDWDDGEEKDDEEDNHGLEEWDEADLDGASSA